MRRLVLSLVLLLALGLAEIANAQGGNPPAYQLRIPDIETYLAALPDLMLMADEDSQDDTPCVLGTALEAEFLSRYGNTATPTQIMTAYDVLYGNWYCTGFTKYPLEPDRWMTRLIQNGFNAAPPALQAGQTLTLDRLTIGVDAQDFDQDGQLEFVLHAVYLVSDGEYSWRNYENFLLATADANEPAGFRITAVPLPWRADGFHYTSIKNANVRENYFEDINQDGLLEWVIELGGLGSGSWGDHSEYWYTYVLGWQDNHLVQLAPRIRTVWAQGVLRNVDDDPALELLEQSQSYVDNWSCAYTDEFAYDWDGTAYVLVPLEKGFSDTPGCLARQAEEAMWRGDVAEALAGYEAFFERYVPWDQPDCDCGIPPSTEQLAGYLTVRRILAHALLGHEAETTALLAEVRASDWPASWGFRWYIDALLATESFDPAMLCQAAYEAFVDYRTPATSIEYGALQPGVIVENAENLSWLWFPVPTPERAGCDPGLLTGQPAPTPPPTPQSSANSASEERSVSPWDSFNDHRWAAQDSVVEGEPLQVLDHVAQANEAAEQMQGSLEDYTNENASLRFYRALALETLDRPEEALNEYVALFEDSVGTVWEKLAGLHFEPRGDR